jgi:hypothetical protein
VYLCQSGLRQGVFTGGSDEEACLQQLSLEPAFKNSSWETTRVIFIGGQVSYMQCFPSLGRIIEVDAKAVRDPFCRCCLSPWPVHTERLGYVPDVVLCCGLCLALLLAATFGLVSNHFGSASLFLALIGISAFR